VNSKKVLIKLGKVEKISYICKNINIPLMKQESEYKTSIKKKSVKLKEYPFKKGDIVGSFIINNDDYVYHHKRYQVEMICSCGEIKYRRINHIMNNKNIWCSKCRGYNIYPERRKSSANFTNGINISWLTSVNANLERGTRLLYSNISLEDLRLQYDLQEGICVYTGIALNVIDCRKRESNASIDRKDSSKGYSKENIQWVYKPVNIMKNSFSEEEFIFVCKKVSNFKDNFEPSSTGM
jgi:hypothetical protein